MRFADSLREKNLILCSINTIIYEEFRNKLKQRKYIRAVNIVKNVLRFTLILYFDD